MRALRYLYLLALSVWLGGMVVLGALVAPVTFSSLEAADPASGRLLAGTAFAAVIARFHYLAYGAGAILVATLAVTALRRPRPRSSMVRLGLAALMLAVSLYSGLVVLSEIDTIQQDVGGLPSILPAGDARRVRFDRLHERSTQLMTLNVAGALVLLLWEARE
jgi:hypothetical protein